MAENVCVRKDQPETGWERACTPRAIQWLLENITSPKNTQASENLQSLSWTYIGGQWSEDHVATATVAQRRADG